MRWIALHLRHDLGFRLKAVAILTLQWVVKLSEEAFVSLGFFV
jgi:hypothetical protein